MKIFRCTDLNTMIVVAFIAVTPLAGGELAPGPTVKVEVIVTDRNGNSVEGAETKITYRGVAPGQGREVFAQTTGIDGRVAAEGALNGSVEIGVRKQGWYPASWPDFLIKGMWDGKKSASARIVLSEINNPVALHARTADMSLPEFDEWVGFDFQAGDWISPHGVGRRADIEFFVSRRFEGFAYPEEDFRGGINKDVNEERLRYTYGKWHGILRMRVPTKGGGIHIEKDGYHCYSLEPSISYRGESHWEMRMPHQAPEAGYRSEPLTWERNYPAPAPPDPMVGYFLETRVTLDEAGNAVSAHYARIMTSDAKNHGSDIYFDPRGKISFTYFFNPTANDRNLEFDTSSNLFPNLTETEQVRFP